MIKKLCLCIIILFIFNNITYSEEQDFTENDVVYNKIIIKLFSDMKFDSQSVTSYSYINGSEFTIIEKDIDKFNNVWYKVKAKDGKIGYLYDTILTRNYTEWTLISNIDKMTGKPIDKCTIGSQNLINLDFPYSDLQRGILQIRKHPRYGTDIIFSVEKGQILCDSYHGCYVNILFDNGNYAKYTCNGPSDYSSNVIFISNYKNLLEKIKKSKKMLIEVPFYQNGNIIFEFDIKNIPKI